MGTPKFGGGIILATPRGGAGGNPSSQKIWIVLENTWLKVQLVLAIFRWVMVVSVCSKSAAVSNQSASTEGIGAAVVALADVAVTARVTADVTAIDSPPQPL